MYNLIHGENGKTTSFTIGLNYKFFFSEFDHILALHSRRLSTSVI